MGSITPVIMTIRFCSKCPNKLYLSLSRSLHNESSMPEWYHLSTQLHTFSLHTNSIHSPDTARSALQFQHLPQSTTWGMAPTAIINISEALTNLISSPTTDSRLVIHPDSFDPGAGHLCPIWKQGTTSQPGCT